MNQPTTFATILLAFSLALPATAFAYPSKGTFGGPSKILDYNAAIQPRAKGERCRGTMCGKPMKVRYYVAPEQSEATSNSATSPKALGFRARCFATFCPEK